MVPKLSQKFKYVVNLPKEKKKRRATLPACPSDNLCLLAPEEREALLTCLLAKRSLNNLGPKRSALRTCSSIQRSPTCSPDQKDLWFLGPSEEPPCLLARLSWSAILLLWRFSKSKIKSFNKVLSHRTKIFNYFLSLITVFWNLCTR